MHMKQRQTPLRPPGLAIGVTTALLAMLNPLTAGSASATPPTLQFQTYQGPAIVKVWQKQFASLAAGTNGFKVAISTEPTGVQAERLLTQAAASQLPDVAMISGRWVPALASRGLLVPLTQQFLGKDLPLNNFQPSLLGAYSYKGVLYGLPTDFDIQVLFYNKNLFNASHVGLPNPNWTWDNYREAAKELTKKTASGQQYGSDVSGDDAYVSLSAIAMSYGGYMINPTTGTPDLTSGGGLKALQLYADLYGVDKSNVPPGNSNDNIGNGNIAMGIYGPWAAWYLLKAAKFQWGMTTLPRGTSAPVTSAWGSAMVVFKSSKQKADALKFLDYFFSKKLQTQRASDWAWTPPTKTLLSSNSFALSDMMNLTAAQKHTILRAAAESRTPVFIPQDADLEQDLGSVLSAFTVGRTNARAAAKTLTSQWQQLINTPM
jgi:ABC-type glycerol-3-phosphate transport system substrate-binding protein